MQGIMILGAIIAAAGTLPYMLAVMRGTVRPRLISWAIWAVLAAVMTVSAVAAGELASALLSFVSFAGCLAITILGWRHGAAGFGRLDIVCLLGAIAGIASLVLLGNPLASIVIALAVDALAFVPTLIHAWRSPNEESLTCFTLASFGAMVALVAVLAGGQPTATGLLYPAYSTIFNAIAALLLIIGRLGPLTRYGYRYGSEEV